MKKIFAALALSLLPLPLVAAAPPSPVERMRDEALAGDKVAWDIVEDLTTEVGPRLAGTEAEARARQWAVKRLKALGFHNVHIEDATMATWVRGAETAEIVAPFPQRLVLTALGGSGATAADGLTADVVGFDSIDALRAAPADAVRGKIVFVGHAMQPNQDGSGYGYYGAVRRSAPAVGAQKGAVAVVIRSLGTDYHRNPHTGLTTWGGVTPIPAAALSIPDAENLQRMLKRAQRVTMHLTLTPRFLGDTPTGNVVADVPGTDPAAGMILVGGHLDSWDLGTGAIDDASGVAIVTAAAKRILDGPRPRRTIRVIWFGDEETGGAGSRAYFAAHRQDNVVFVGESDFGADRVWKFVPGFAEANKPLADRVAAALFPLGINLGRGEVEAGADLGAWVRAGAAGADLAQDGTRYFDYHHTPDDTLDKVDPARLRQNVAAWLAMLRLVADAPEPIAKLPPRPERRP
ncbi:MAG: M20/M25/M40 family metallo-hydrolase [Alphaproteobacteria bacterium]|nr:M20/M25/M40 family metallo-hydrolase [Alphaproteobacteria bacterium]